VGKSAIQVSLLELLDAPTEAITSLDRFDLIALDDIEAISGVPHWQRAVFHLINYNNEGGGQLVFSSRFAPIELKLELPDLQSRLTQAVSVRVPNGSLYADRYALVSSVLDRRGIHLDPQIFDYLLNYGSHQTSVLLQTLEQIIQLLKGEKLKVSHANLRQIYALIDEYR
ncbi:DnaA/Hda family protein, partial [uncultured Acinetobacter sp.]|uniref:DnaA ATPase domain-containing protein n=1 Tax=uncultured Acinetobacter sp. TaxID=165433 RepID=UPI00260A6A00